MSFAPRIASAHRTASDYYEVRPLDVAQRSDLYLVDVRDEAELLGELGHIHNVHHVEAAAVLSGALGILPAETPLLILCRNGRTSAQCATFLARAGGFREVYLLVGGMVRWVGEERPVARTRTYT
ncbi:MAG: rhodanese-like domain-containing protein [Sandaracinaceae bacterium]|nr:rhodanese-like domain-containing protein [Sandaracinaceae bacterium]